MEPNLTEVALLYKAWAWFDANKKRVAWGGGIVVTVILVVWFLVSQKEEREIKASEAVANLLMRPKANQSDTTAALLRVASENPNSAGGAEALLLAAGSLFTEGKFVEAQAQFDKFAREHRDSPCLGTALLGVAASLDAQNKTNDAFTAYKSLVERHPNDLVVPQAKFALGRIYEAQGKPELALQCFQDVARLGVNNAVGNEAGMRAEDLIAKFPNLLPTPVAPTNAPVLKIPSQPATQPVQPAAKASPAPAAAPAKKSK